MFVFSLAQYGLGARYEHGELPRLRVALELYTPLPELHTVFLDLCDNSTASDVKYDVTMKYGPTKHLKINVDLKVRHLLIFVMICLHVCTTSFPISSMCMNSQYKEKEVYMSTIPG